MIGFWLAFTLVLGKAWCSYACFFGGIEEGFAALPKHMRIRKIDREVAAGALGAVDRGRSSLRGAV